MRTKAGILKTASNSPGGFKIVLGYLAPDQVAGVTKPHTAPDKNFRRSDEMDLVQNTKGDGDTQKKKSNRHVGALKKNNTKKYFRKTLVEGAIIDIFQ